MCIYEKDYMDTRNDVFSGNNGWGIYSAAKG